MDIYTVSQWNWYHFCFGNKSVNSKNNPNNLFLIEKGINYHCFLKISSNSVKRVQSYAHSKFDKQNLNFPTCKNSFFIKLYNSTKTWKLIWVRCCSSKLMFKMPAINSNTCSKAISPFIDCTINNSLIKTIPFLYRDGQRRVCGFDKHVLEERSISCSRPGWDQGY